MAGGAVPLAVLGHALGERCCWGLIVSCAAPPLPRPCPLLQPEQPGDAGAHGRAAGGAGARRGRRQRGLRGARNRSSLHLAWQIG